MPLALILHRAAGVLDVTHAARVSPRHQAIQAFLRRYAADFEAVIREVPAHGEDFGTADVDVWYCIRHTCVCCVAAGDVSRKALQAWCWALSIRAALLAHTLPIYALLINLATYVAAGSVHWVAALTAKARRIDSAAALR